MCDASAMRDAQVIAWIADKYQAVSPEPGERGRRLWAAAEARSLGWGGISAVAKATGISDRTIRNGIGELDSCAGAEGRQRRAGGGRRSREAEQPRLVPALDSIVEPGSRGDPESPLRWTCLGTRALARLLGKKGLVVSHTKVGWSLRELEYSLQANRKTREGKRHAGRDAQFRRIARRVKDQLRKGEPSLSVDTKKKEILGNHNSPSPRSPAGGGSRDASGIPGRRGCSSPPMPAAATRRRTASGRSRCRSWPTTRAWSSRRPTSRPAQANGTGSNTACSATSPAPGRAARWKT